MSSETASPSIDGRFRKDEESDVLFAGRGEMRARCRACDWAATPLGPVSGWSQSLRTTVGIVMATRNPMFLFWGPELVQLYNDDYRPSFGENGRHPAALGIRGKDCWTDIWDTIGPQLAQVMTTGEATWYEDQYLAIERNHGLEDTWWTYSYSPVYDDDGSIGGTLVVCQETTRRVVGERELVRLLSEIEVERARLSDVFRRAPSFIVAFRDVDMRYEFVNEAYYQLVGHRDILGKPLLEALPELRDQGFKELLDEVLATGEPWVGREALVMLQRTPGAPEEARYVDLVLQSLTDADGCRSGVVAHGSDVTEHVLARREVERLLVETERLLAESEGARSEAETARTEAETANRAKGEFLAVMSHELRTPLHAIGGYAELMELGIRGPVTVEQRVDLGRIQQSQKHLLGLINQILNYTRIETGIVMYDLASVSVVEALAAVAVLVVPQMRARGLDYVIDHCNSTLRLHADAEKLQQILLNLLTNATKFTHAGGEIRVSGSARAGVIAISVSDSGVGIAPDKLAMVFEPFMQAESGYARQNDGLGLGLAISRELARGMGGDISAESTLGVGSTFTVTLPAALPALPALDG